jgi:hypothetical protein
MPATAPSAGATATQEADNPWQAQLDEEAGRKAKADAAGSTSAVAATATGDSERGDNPMAQDHADTAMATESPKEAKAAAMDAAEEDATEEAMREAISRSTRPETASSSAARDLGDQVPTMESSEAMQEQEAIERSLQAPKTVVAAASATPPDDVVAQLDQFRLQEAERIEKLSEDAATAKTKAAAAATAGASKPKRTRRRISPPKEGWQAGQTRQANKANVGDDAELLATPLAVEHTSDNLPAPSLPAAAADPGHLLPAMPTRPVPKAPPSQTQIDQHTRGAALAPVPPRDDSPEGPAGPLSPHDPDDATIVPIEADAMVAAAADPTVKTEPPAREAMIIEVTAATADAPDPNATTAATADSSQTGATSNRQLVADVLPKSEDYMVRRIQDQNIIASDPDVSREERPEAKADVSRAFVKLRHFRQRIADEASATTADAPDPNATTAAPADSSQEGDEALQTQSVKQRQVAESRAFLAKDPKRRERMRR